MSELELRRARTSAGEIAYADEGEGPPVLLLHGFPTSSHLWRDLLPMLSMRFRAIAPDLLGYGDSEKPAEARLGIGDQTGHLRELVQELGLERFAVVGHDIGGAIAQVLALELDIAAIVVMDGVTPWTTRSEPLLKLQQAKPEAADEEFAEGVLRGTFELGMGNRERLADRDRDEFVRPWREDPAALLRAAQALVETGLEGREEDLAKLDIPALLLWGEEDLFVPAQNGERLWETLPDSAFAVLPGCGHFLTEDAGETVLPLVVQFLRTKYLREEGHDHAPAGAIPLDLGVSFERPPHPRDELVDE